MLEFISLSPIIYHSNSKKLFVLGSDDSEVRADGRLMYREIHV